MKDKDKKQKKTEKPEPEQQPAATPNTTEKKGTKKTVVIRKIKQGAGSISRSGDFIGRLGTLLVMLVTSISTGTIMVTSFIEAVYWKGALHAGLLAFIHIPMIAVMIWFMCKARMQSIYNKIRPSKQGQITDVTDIENETVIYEETIEVPDNENEKKTEKKTGGQKVANRITAVSKEAEQLKQQKRKPKVMNGVKNAGQINKAFDHAVS